MGMSQAGAPYRSLSRSLSRVVEFDEGRRIAWESMGAWRGRKVVGGQRWRYVLHPRDGGTVVEHSYVWGYAVLPLLTVRAGGYPRRAALEPGDAFVCRLLVEPHSAPVSGRTGRHDEPDHPRIRQTGP